MKKNLILLSAIVFSGLSFGQVGINNDTPKATLDITAKATDGTTAEGIIAPRLTGDQIQAKDSKYGPDQKAAIVYALLGVTNSSAKTANITSEGYYYFDGTLWQKLVNASGGNTLYSANGTLSDNRTVTINPNKTLKFTGGGFVGIGTETPKRLLHLSANTAGTPSMLVLDNVNTSPGTSSNGTNLSFRGTTTGAGGTAFKEFAAIQAGYEVLDHATARGSIRFHTVEGMGSDIKERMRISKDGYVGIGTAVPKTRLQVVGLPSFASHQAARDAGLTPGAFYQTSGTGEGIFANLGVLMVAQPQPPLSPQ